MKRKIVVDIEEKKYKSIIKKFQTFPKEMKEWGLEEIKNGKPLEQELVLDKIRDDIMKLQTYKMFKGEDTVYVERDDVLASIDKYREERKEYIMKFEVGKTYRHNAGERMTIIGRLKTHTYGECLIGENDKGDFIPVGESEEHAINWNEAESEVKE